MAKKDLGAQYLEAAQAAIEHAAEKARQVLFGEGATLDDILRTLAPVLPPDHPIMRDWCVLREARRKAANG